MTEVGSARLWQVGHKRPLAHPVISSFALVGSMVVTAGGGRLRRTGRLTPGHASG